MACGSVNEPFEYLRCAIVDKGTAEERPLTGVGDFLGIAINILLGAVISISLISIIMSGIKFVISRGDPKATGTAKQALTYAIVSFVLGIGAFTLKAIIFDLLGITQRDLTDATPRF